ncbi:uracil-DNA glycosylase family protein [Enterococcus sp. LJL90]
MTNKKENFEILAQQIAHCRICEGRLDPAPVFRGDQQSKIVHISQAPSKTVAETKMPFTDASGRKLRQEWYQISEEEFYLETNFCFAAVGLCFPGKNKSGGDKQPPAICGKTWLAPILEAVDYQLMILVGGKAANHFFPKADFSSLVFENQEINGRPAIILPHPSPLNIKWFKDHPDFYLWRLAEVRQQVQTVLQIN